MKFYSNRRGARRPGRGARYDRVVKNSRGGIRL